MERKVSVNIISLGRDSIYKTLETIKAQVVDFEYEINIILQGELDTERVSKNVNIYQYERGLGFGYYRNEAIKKSNGKILVWIDDDEYAKNENWLSEITSPILNGEYLVVTAGTDIQLGMDYITDCISFLGYPGGGALGFRKMWTVFNDNTTNHLCSGNFAFHRDILKTITGFKEELKSGAEDVAFGTELSRNNIQIFYNEYATIWHEQRSGIKNFCKWHVGRGKSIAEFKRLGLIGKGHLFDKGKSMGNILFGNFFTIYMPGIWFMFFLQNISNIYGMTQGK